MFIYDPTLEYKISHGCIILQTFTACKSNLTLQLKALEAK